MTTTDEDDGENIQKFDEASEKYQDCKVKIIETIQNKLRPKVHESTRNDVSMTYQNVSNLKLPPCDTHPFEGGFSKWPAFRDIFQAVFINHPGLSQAQKLYHLRCKTRGEALQIVQRFDLVDSNFVLAWEALKNRYENTRILVHQQMKKLFGAPVASSETPKSIRQIQSCINDSVSIFKSFKVKTDDWDPILIHLCSTKLPEETLRAWEDSLSDHKELPSWSQLDAFLSKRIEILETITDFKKPNHKENQNSKSQIFYSQSEGENNKICKKCKRNHSLRHCKQFKSLTPQERLKFVYANKYCANCLSPDHFKSKCSSNLSCVKCKKKHHTMLHVEKYGNNRNSHRENSPTNNSNDNRYLDLPSSSNVSNEENNNQNDAVQVHFAQNNGATVLPTALINLVYAGEKFLVRALLDGGSERSFITKRIQQQLKLPIRRQNNQISGLGGTVVGNSNGTCYVEVQSRNTNFSMKINMIIVPKLAHLLPAKQVKVQDIGDLSNFELADPYFYKPSPIDVIIGSDYLPQINMEGIRLDIAQGLEVRESKFGWYLSGPMPISEINSFSTLVCDYDYTDLNEQLKKFWEIEEAEFRPPVNDNDSYCEEYFKRTTIRDENGRYVVRLPFRPEFPQEIFLGASKKSALAQYLRMDKNLEKTPDLKKEYNKVLQEYIDLDHMEPVNHQEEGGEKQMSFFLPHHAVVKPNRKSTKVRVVFNGSKKTSNGISLNNVLLQGPTLLADLTQIILGWRFYQYVFTGDIEKMYRQVLLHPEDRKYQLIFFRSNSDDQVKIYQLKTVTFGINCAPFLAIRSLIQLSEDCKENFELGSHVLRNETYVDDVLSGGHDIEEAKAKQLQLMQILKSANFPLKKITSNNDLLLQHLAREDLLDEDFLKFDESSTTKTLGIGWNAKSDEFFYKVESIERNVVTTKRIILSVIARIYDPLGWLGPIIIIAKLLMQSLWQEKIDWNDPVPSNLLVTWNKFVDNLSVVSTLRIPRWVEFSPRKRIQIHGFSDASERAYCGAIYIRVQDSEGVISSHFLIAKTKIAPLKSITIPKLELCGALLMAKLMKSLSVKYDIEKFYWTDSSIVLGWLQKSPQSLKTFVANRVTKLNEISDVDRWRHVSTEDNPADLGTRGSTPQELQKNMLWWHGPPWLRTQEEQWPKPRTFDPTDIETKKTSTFHLEIQNEHFINRFSSYNKAIRVLCQIYRFIKKCQHKLHQEGEALSTDEITFAKYRLIIMAQKAHYAQEYEQLESKLPLSKKSTILTLTPFLDKNGLIRVGGRLNNSGFSYEERHPVLIPDKSHLSNMELCYDI
ncbi:uncharacterized protein LOC142231017 [Haematobia irritans]|uniref:uncharacterized protein LOC142231017 n=1 Tax=Haematobia irritans TaxID=7368 RepID=UPI003F5011DF